MDVVHRRAVAADRRQVPIGEPLSDLAPWIEAAFGHRPTDLTPYERALTHGSHAAATYERLEFLGDRVLGLVIAEWLFELFPADTEGALSKRYNAVVTGAACADVARALGVVPHLHLGKQARDDGAADSDNVLGDVMEALLGALYLDAGLDVARAAIRRLWTEKVRSDGVAPQHPKSALQEWAAANNRKPPVYELVDRSGPGHAPRFTVKVTLGRHAEAVAEGRSKQDAETTAARVLLDQVMR